MCLLFRKTILRCFGFLFCLDVRKMLCVEIYYDFNYYTSVWWPDWVAVSWSPPLNDLLPGSQPVDGLQLKSTSPWLTVRSQRVSGCQLKSTTHWFLSSRSLRGCQLKPTAQWLPIRSHPVGGCQCQCPPHTLASSPVAGWVVESWSPPHNSLLFGGTLWLAVRWSPPHITLLSGETLWVAVNFDPGFTPHCSSPFFK